MFLLGETHEKVINIEGDVPPAFPQKFYTYGLTNIPSWPMYKGDSYMLRSSCQFH